MQSSMALGGKVMTELNCGPMHTYAPLWWKIKNFKNIAAAWRIPFAKLFGIPTFYGKLYAVLNRPDGSIVDYGLVSGRLVTTAFCAFLVDQMQTDSAVIGDFKYHDSGSGAGPTAAIGDTSLETAITDNLRTAGTQVETSSVIYKSVGAIAYTGAHDVTEHGLFCDTRANGGTMVDHHYFTAIPVVNLDSITFTYELTVTAGG
jgi:hypothetical protein